jgi:Domain of unknown function (DUF4399)
MNAMAMTRMALISAVLLLPSAGFAQDARSPEDARVYFIWPEAGATVKGAFRARFGLRNMGVTHAGDNFPNSGHHHLFIDVDQPIDPNAAIPHDKNHIHFAAGETEAPIELPPGKHTLQLVLGDGEHFPFNPPVVSEKITITVKGGGDVAEDAQAARAPAGRRKTAVIRPPPAARRAEATRASVNATPGNCTNSLFSQMISGCKTAR